MRNSVSKDDLEKRRSICVTLRHTRLLMSINRRRNSAWRGGRFGWCLRLTNNRLLQQQTWDELLFATGSFSFATSPLVKNRWQQFPKPVRIRHNDLKVMIWERSRLGLKYDLCQGGACTTHTMAAAVVGSFSWWRDELCTCSSCRCRRSPGIRGIRGQHAAVWWPRRRTGSASSTPRDNSYLNS